MKINKKSIMSILGVIVCSLVVIIISRQVFKGGFLNDKYGKGMEFYKGRVISVVSEELTKDMALEDVEIGFQEVVVRVNEGPHKGEEYQIENPVSRLYNFKVEEGTKVILGSYLRGDEVVMNIYNYDRSNVLYILIVIFIVTVIIIGGVKGIKSLIALVFTLVCCIFLMIPLMLTGVSPIIAGIFVAILSIIVTLLLVSGINRKTTTAILGTIIGVVISGVIAYVFGKLTKLSGINMSDAESMIYIAEDTALNVSGIMFAGILIASLGAVMDVAMSISSAVFEMEGIDNSISFNRLFKSAMNIGKDIIGTMTNTLILAFAGGSISVLILIFSAEMPYNKLINLDILGIELIQGLSGSIGIVLSVPITALIGSYLCKVKSGKVKSKIK